MKEYLEQIKGMASVDLDAIDGQIIKWIQEFSHHQDAELTAHQCAVGYLKSSIAGIINYIDNHVYPIEFPAPQKVADKFAGELEYELRCEIQRRIRCSLSPLSWYSKGRIKAIRIGDNGENDVGFELLVTEADGVITDINVEDRIVFYRDKPVDASELVDLLIERES